MFKSKIVDDIRLNIACESLYQECLEGNEDKDVLTTSTEGIGMAIGVALLAFFAWIVSKIIKVFSIGKQISDAIVEELKKLTNVEVLKHTAVTKKQLVDLAGIEACQKHNWNGQKIFGEFEKQVENLMDMGVNYDEILTIIEMFAKAEDYSPSYFIRYANNLKKHLNDCEFPGGYQVKIEQDEEKNTIHVDIIKPDNSLNDEEGKEKIAEFETGVFLSADFTDRWLSDLDARAEKIKIGSKKLEESIKDKTKKLDEFSARKDDSVGLTDKEIKELEILYNCTSGLDRESYKKLFDSEERLTSEQAFAIYKKHIEFTKNVTGELLTKIIPFVEAKMKPIIRHYLKICTMAEVVEK